MSAPPTGLPNGQGRPGAPQDPNARPRPPPFKRKPRADPMVARKKPQPKPAPGSSAAGPSRSQPSASTHLSPEAQTTALLSKITEHRAKAAANGGWSEPKPPNCHEFTVVTTKRALFDGIRHHAMKFHSTSNKDIDVTKQEDFTRPVTLQRRDPRQPAPGRETKQPEEPPPEPSAIDEKEAERIAKLKAEKEAWKAAEAAKSAPSMKDPKERVKQPKQEERGVSFYRQPRSALEKKQMDLRYEEALPWHLEDADGKNVWVGSYVAPMSETHVCLVATHDGKFAMVPIEKWYKFVAKPNFETMKLEEAEALAKQSNGISRWVMQNREKQAKQKEMDETRSYFHGPARIKTESSTFRNASREERFDHDQIDFEGDEFQDDDEAPNFEPDNDEDQKNADDRIRRNQLGANLFGDADEGQVEKEELEQKLLEEIRRKEGKKMTKALIKREKETIYQTDDSDSGYDPFESSSVSSRAIWLILIPC
jgi:transcription initiation factor TFIIF subunit alpha